MSEDAGEQQLPQTLVRTFLIADIRGFSTFTHERGDEAGARLASAFAVIAREAVKDGQGRLLELRGDEALSVFDSTRQALRTAVDLQTRFARHSEEHMDLPLRVGIGIDAGEAIPVEGGYRGGALNMAARLCSLAGAGQILASEAVTHLARRVEGLAYIERGPTQLKGFSEPVRVVEVVAEGEMSAWDPARETSASPVGRTAPLPASDVPSPPGSRAPAPPHRPRAHGELDLDPTISSFGEQLSFIIQQEVADSLSLRRERHLDEARKLRDRAVRRRAKRPATSALAELPWPAMASAATLIVIVAVVVVLLVK